MTIEKLIERYWETFESLRQYDDGDLTLTKEFQGFLKDALSSKMPLSEIIVQVNKFKFSDIKE